MEALKEMPPDRITIACFTYMVRTMELREFNRFFFGAIENSDKLTINLTEGSKSDFNRAASEYKKKSGGMTPGRQLVNEVMLTRSIESFDLYLLQMLRLLFSVKPALVIEEEKLNDESNKADFDNPNDYFLHLAERKLMKLSYKSLSALREYIRTSGEIELFETNTIFETIFLATELRNLIAHNDCRVNEIFLKRTKILSSLPNLELGERFAISDALVDRCIRAMDHAVFSYDEASAKRHDIPNMNRMTSFFFRGDFAPATI